MDVFTLTETEFFRQLTEGKNDNLHIAYKNFVLEVSRMCNEPTPKRYVVTALLYAEIEIASIQTTQQRDEVNNLLTTFINKALHFVRQTLTHYKELSFTPVPEDNCLEEIGLNWTANKTALIELGYAFKVAKCFGTTLSAREIVRKLAKLFNVDMSDTYIYKKYCEMRVRGRNSRTYFMDTLSNSLNEHMDNQDLED